MRPVLDRTWQTVQMVGKTQISHSVHSSRLIVFHETFQRTLKDILFQLNNWKSSPDSQKGTKKRRIQMRQQSEMSVFIYLQIKPNLFLNGIQRKTTKSTRTHSYIYICCFLRNVSLYFYIMKKRKWNVSKFHNPDGVWGASISVLNSYPVGISLGLWPSSALAWWWNSAQEKSTFHQKVFS